MANQSTKPPENGASLDVHFNIDLKGSQSYKQAQKPFQKLSPEQEKHLADWVLAQTALGLPQTHQELLFLRNESFKLLEKQRALKNVG